MDDLSRSLDDLMLFARRPPQPTLYPDGGAVQHSDSLYITLRETQGHKILFTTDFSDPSEEAIGEGTQVYTSPIRFSTFADAELLVRAVTMREADHSVSHETQRAFAIMPPQPTPSPSPSKPRVQTTLSPRVGVDIPAPGSPPVAVDRGHNLLRSPEGRPEASRSPVASSASPVCDPVPSAAVEAGLRTPQGSSNRPVGSAGEQASPDRSPVRSQPVDRSPGSQQDPVPGAQHRSPARSQGGSAVPPHTPDTAIAPQPSEDDHTASSAELNPVPPADVRYSDPDIRSDGRSDGRSERRRPQSASFGQAPPVPSAAVRRSPPRTPAAHPEGVVVGLSFDTSTDATPLHDMRPIRSRGHYMDPEQLERLDRIPVDRPLMSIDDVPLKPPPAADVEQVTMLDVIGQVNPEERRRWDPVDSKFKTKLEWSRTAEDWDCAEVEAGQRYTCDLCGRGWDEEGRMQRHRRICHGHSRGLSPSRHVTFEKNPRNSRGTTTGSQQSGPGTSTSGPCPGRGRAVNRTHSDTRSHDSDGRASQSSLATSGLSFVQRAQRRSRSETGRNSDGDLRGAFASPPESSASSLLGRRAPRGPEPNIHNPNRKPLESAGKRLVECKWCHKQLSVKAVDAHENVCGEAPHRRENRKREQDRRRRSPSPGLDGEPVRVSRSDSTRTPGRRSPVDSRPVPVPKDAAGRRSPLDSSLHRSGSNLQKSSLQLTVQELEKQRREMMQIQEQAKGKHDWESCAKLETQIREVTDQITRKRAIDGGRRLVPPARAMEASSASSSIMRAPSVPSQKLIDARQQRKNARMSGTPGTPVSGDEDGQKSKS
eukprot:Hpha_TRINITY_DN14793_c0_g1::TRINITY_DN14793_c0_g1_i1::g.102885::m.102885